MRANRQIMLLMFVVAIFTGCLNNDRQAGRQGKGLAEEDSTSVRDAAENACYDNFFRELPRFKDSNSAQLVLQNGNEVTMTRFFKDEFMGPVSQYGTKDLDGDGTAELVIYNNTGGAHCCDEFYVFRQQNVNRFVLTAHLLGSACVDAATNVFTYSLSETFGYFFGCYACGFEDSTGTFKTLREIRLQYRQGQLAVVPYDANEERQNLTNLKVLHDHGFEKVEGMMDSGWRKEFAMNFAVWYFNHEKNWEATHILFNKFYTFKDAPAIWQEFYATLKEATKENTF